MRRKLALWLCLIFVLPLTIPSALASQVTLPAEGFLQEQHLYVFAAVKGESPLTATLQLSDIPNYSGTTELKSMDGLPASYLFLVDTSNSMRQMKSSIRSFIQALTNADRTDAVYSLATIGDQFQLVLSDATRPAQLLQALDRQSLTAQSSDLSRGILEALDYLYQRPRRAGELVNLVIITDAIPERAEDAPSMEIASEQINSTHSVLTHTFGFAVERDGSAEALNILGSMGTGVHTTLEVSGTDAVDKGSEIAQFVNGLYAADFPLFELELPLGADGTVSVFQEQEALCNVLLQRLPVLGQEQVPPELFNPAPEPALPSHTGQPDEPSQPAPSAESEPMPVQAPVQPDSKSAIPLIVLTAVCAAAVCGGLFFFLRRRNQRKPVKTGGIYMKLEVISGQCAADGQIFQMSDQLLIGRRRGCDICFKDREVAPQNTRVFCESGMIYIEDLGSECGTALGGMRLHGANRLRSGDEISVGSVCFRFLF